MFSGDGTHWSPLVIFVGIVCESIDQPAVCELAQALQTLKVILHRLGRPQPDSWRINMHVGRNIIHIACLVTFLQPIITSRKDKRNDTCNQGCAACSEARSMDQMQTKSPSKSEGADPGVATVRKWEGKRKRAQLEYAH